MKKEELLQIIDYCKKNGCGSRGKSDCCPHDLLCRFFSTKPKEWDEDKIDEMLEFINDLEWEMLC